MREYWVSVTPMFALDRATLVSFNCRAEERGRGVVEFGLCKADPHIKNSGGASFSRVRPF